MKFHVLMIAMLCGACSSTLYTENSDEITVHLGTGGLVRPIMARYSEWAASGRRLIIDGQVVSADAIEAFSYPGACYTENAIWSPHAASGLGLYRLGRWTDLMASKLPAPLEAWFREDHSYYDWIGFASVDYQKLLEIWPEGACRQEDTTPEGRARVARNADLKQRRFGREPD